MAVDVDGAVTCGGCLRVGVALGFDGEDGPGNQTDKQQESYPIVNRNTQETTT